MKSSLFLIIVVFLLKQSVFSQNADSVPNTLRNRDKVSFITIFDQKFATKDGYYLNGYVVNIKYDLAKKIHLKKIKVTGRITIVKGLKHDKSGIEKQGRYEDAKHILKPRVEILD